MKNKKTQFTPDEVLYIKELGWGGTLSGAGTGAAAGASVGSIFGPIGTGVGGAFGAVVGGIAGHFKEEATEKTLAKKKEMVMNQVADQNFWNSQDGVQGGVWHQRMFADGGQMPGMMPDMVQEYKGQTHQGPNGGIPVDKKGNPSVTGDRGPIAKVENGEVSWNGYVFSNRLKSANNKTFADEAKVILNKYKKRLGDKFQNDDKMASEAMGIELKKISAANDAKRAELNTSINDKMLAFGGPYEDFSVAGFDASIGADTGSNIMKNSGEDSTGLTKGMSVGFGAAGMLGSMGNDMLESKYANENAALNMYAQKNGIMADGGELPELDGGEDLSVLNYYREKYGEKIPSLVNRNSVLSPYYSIDDGNPPKRRKNWYEQTDPLNPEEIMYNRAIRANNNGDATGLGFDDYEMSIIQKQNPPAKPNPPFVNIPYIPAPKFFNTVEPGFQVPDSQAKNTLPEVTIDGRKPINVTKLDPKPIPEETINNLTGEGSYLSDTTTSTRKPFEYKSDILNYIPGAVNTIRGIFDKVDKVDPNDYMLDANITPRQYRTREAEKQIETANYNRLRAYNPSSPTANAAQRIASDVAASDQVSRMKESAFNVNEGLAGRAEELNMRTREHNNRIKLGISDINDRNEAAKDALITTGIGQLSEAARYNLQDKNTQEMLYDMYPEYDTTTVKGAYIPGKNDTLRAPAKKETQPSATIESPNPYTKEQNPYVSNLEESNQSNTESVNTEARSVRNNNPGNLKPMTMKRAKQLWGDSVTGVDKQGHAIFRSSELGRKALIQDITAKANRDLTVEEFVKVYAPDASSDSTKNYIIHIAKKLGITSSDKIKGSDYNKLADAITKFEGGE